VLIPLRRGTAGRASEYDAFTLVPAYLAHQERTLLGVKGDPRGRAFTAQAELNEFRLAKERGDYLPKAEWVRLGQNLTAALNAMLAALPSRLARRGVIPSAREPETLEAVDEMRRELAAWETAEDLVKAATAPHHETRDGHDPDE
jgi:hypothetical protein